MAVSLPISWGYVMNKAHELMDFTDYRDLFDKYDTLKKNLL